jgi:hypothetical protein
VRKRERPSQREGEKKEGGQGRDKEEGEASRAAPGILLGLHSQAGGGARGWPGTATQVPRLTQRRRQSNVCKNPPSLWGFLETLKQHYFACVGDSNLGFPINYKRFKMFFI